MVKKRMLISSVLVASVVALAACGSSDTSSSSGGGGGSAKDTLVIVAPDSNWTWAFDNGFGGIEPSIQTVGATLIRKPYVDTGEPGFLAQDVNNYEPYLATSYDVSPDGLTYTFHLSNAVSAQGNELTADDVLWSWERRFATKTSISPSIQNPQITSMDQFTKVDDKTVAISIAQPGYGATLLALLADLTSWIYDSTYLKAHATSDDSYAVKFSAENPNYGFGPYEVTDYKPGTSATLEARDDFVLGAPKIKKVLLKVVPDAGTRANLLRSGDADVAEALSFADLEELDTEDGTKVMKVDNPNAYIMMPLLANKAPFDDTLVRQAFAYAIPYDDIIKNVYHGFAVRNGPSFLRTDHPGYDGEGFTDFTYAPDKAKELLAQAGASAPVSFELTVSAAEPDMQEAAVQIQTAAKAAGFNVQIKQVPASAFGEGRTAHSFQAFLLKDYAITLTPSYELNVYTAKEADGAPAGNNLGAWLNDDFDAAKAVGDALPDAYTAEAGKAWNAAEQVFINEAPIPMIAQIQPNFAMRDDVEGATWRSDQYLDFSLLYKD